MRTISSQLHVHSTPGHRTVRASPARAPTSSRRTASSVGSCVSASSSASDASALKSQSRRPAANGRSRRRRSSRRCRSRARAAGRRPGCRRARRGLRRRRAAGCWPTRRRRCRRCARRASAPPRTCGRAALDDDALEAGADVGDLRRGSAAPARRPAAACRGRRAGALAHEAQHRGLQAAEAEVDTPRDVRRQQAGGAVGCGALRSACVRRATGKSNARSLPSRASAIDRPARPDTQARAAWRPCRTPPPPHRLASGRSGDTRPARRRGRGWCARRTRRARPPAAAARRARATSDSMWPAR